MIHFSNFTVFIRAPSYKKHNEIYTLYIPSEAKKLMVYNDVCVFFFEYLCVSYVNIICENIRFRVEKTKSYAIVPQSRFVTTPGGPQTVGNNVRYGNTPPGGGGIRLLSVYENVY